MVQNLRGYSILYVITIKWIMRVEEKIDISSMSQRLRLRPTKILGGISLSTNIKQQ